MGHDYTELMSAALDGRLGPGERAEWNAHLAVCSKCQKRWNALQQIDHTFKSASVMMPAPGFKARFAQRLAQRQAAQYSRQRTFAGAGMLTASAMAALVVIGWVLAWQVPALSGSLADAPAYLSNAAQTVVQWTVLLRALGEIGQSLVSFVPLWGTIAAVIYAWILVALAITWGGIVLQFTRQRAPATLAIS
jgi:anti-sigma factor RsiW